MAYTPDPQWFYSSLSQVTAALVGFFGGVLILRIQTHRSRWRDRREALIKQQKKYGAPHNNSQNNPRELQNQAERLMDQAVDGMDTSLPKEYVIFSLCLFALFVVGIVLPLILLPEPENWIRGLLVGLVAVITVAAVAYIFWSANRALRRYKDECKKTKELIESSLR